MLFDKNKFEFSVFSFFVRLVHKIGTQKIKYLAKILAFIFYYVLRLRLKVVKKNLAIAFPYFDKEKINKIAFSNYYNIALTFLDAMFIPKMTKEELINSVNIINNEVLIDAYNQKKGVFLLTAHFGNWEIGAASVGARMNIPINVLAKPQRNKLVSNWMDKMRSSFGNKVILLGANVKEIYKAIYNKEIVGVVGDQRGPKENGVRVNLFGHSTSTYPGTAAIAIKLKAKLITAMVYRKNDFKYDCVFEEIKLPETEDIDVAIKEINQKYMNILEKFVTLYPEQWFWMHNIWKY
ncbi:MAG TPA: lysophospholipid acyltransferase family protein [Melioribacteraceae bacterium]|nr:lysophospholipid acyltransferase family protein [Melioribacteraceae bacterium]